MERQSGNPTGLTFRQRILSERFYKYISNLSWLVFEKLFSLFVSMVVGIYVARYLQPDNFGLLNYAMSFVGIFAAISTLGLDQILVRELSQDMSKKNDLLGTAFILKVSGSLAMMTVLSVVLLFMKNEPFTNTMIMIIAAAETLRAFEVISYFYQAKVSSKYVVQVQLVVNLVSSAVKFGMVYYQAPLIGFAWIVVLTSLFNAAGYLYTYRRREGEVFLWTFGKRTAVNLLREAWPLTLYGIALYTQARIDQVMLGKMMSNYEVGQYSVALKIIEIFGFIPMVIMSTFSPAIARAKTLSPELYEDRLVNFYRLLFLVFLIVAVPLFLYGEEIIVMLYGTPYRPAGILLSLFALRLFFSNMGVGKSVFIVNESLFRYSLGATLVGATVNIGVNYLLIPVYGSMGAIAASFISFTISIFILDLFFARMRRNQSLMLKGVLTFWKLNRIS